MESRRGSWGIVAGSSLKAERWDGRRRGGREGAGRQRASRGGRAANKAAVAVEAAGAAAVLLAACAEGGKADGCEEEVRCQLRASSVMSSWWTPGWRLTDLATVRAHPAKLTDGQITGCRARARRGTRATETADGGVLVGRRREAALTTYTRLHCLRLARLRCGAIRLDTARYDSICSCHHHLGRQVPVPRTYIPTHLHPTHASSSASMQQDASATAAAQPVPLRAVSAIEHPCIVKNIDKGITSLGGPVKLSRVRASPGFTTCS
jgi:hypothetical protein